MSSTTSTKTRISVCLLVFFSHTVLISQTIPLTSVWSKMGSRSKSLAVSTMATGDVNGDGRLDFVAQANFLQLGNNATFFSQTADDWAIQSGSPHYARRGYLGDHNGDGKKDVVGMIANRFMVFNGINSGLPAAPNQTITLPNCETCGINASFDGNGDLNNDGYDDLVIGAPNTNNFFGERGTVYIYYGSQTGLNSTNLDTIKLPALGVHFGSQIRYAGDVNRDGFDDIIIATQTYAGLDFGEEVYIVYGKRNGLNTPLSIGNGGHNAEDYAHEIGAAGDINGDGFADFYISAARRYAGSAFLKGKVEIVYGRRSGSLDSNVVELDPFVFTQSGNFAQSVASAGDFNDDGFSDLAVTFNEKVLIFTGSRTGLSTRPRFEFTTCCSPVVRYAGDVDKDGFSDLLVGEKAANDDGGRAQLLRGRPSMNPNFNVRQREICITNPVAIFQDSSTEAVSYLWDFGDGAQSTLKNPAHRYARTGVFSIKLTTKDAKGHAWSITKDSLIIVREPLAGGTYTIGAGGTYPDLFMVNTVCKCGLTGNVTMLFKNGVHAPPTLRLENVDTRGFTLTFDAESGNRDSVVFGPSHRPPFIYAVAPNIILKNTKNVRFKNITSMRIHPYPEATVQIDSCENIGFDNCVFPITAFSDFSRPNVLARYSKNILIENCTFDHGFPSFKTINCDSVRVYKTVSTVLMSDCVPSCLSSLAFDSTRHITVSESHNLHLNISRSRNIKIEKSRYLDVSITECERTEITQNGDNFGLEMKNSVGFKIHKNKHYIAANYLLSDTKGLDTEGYNLIANNGILGGGNIYFRGGGNAKIYHNSVVHTPVAGVSCRGVVRIQNADSVDFRNNLIVQTPESECAFVQIDNNRRYTANHNAYCNNYFFNTDVWNSHWTVGFREFRDLVGQDSSSVNGRVVLNNDLLTPNTETAGLINQAAPFLAETTTDINGNPRPQTGTDIGALEFVAPNNRDFALDSIKTVALDTGNNRISVLFTNRNVQAATNCRLAYQVNDLPIVRETWTGQMTGFAVQNFTFSTPLSITKGKAYFLKVWLENSAEGTRQNDTLGTMLFVPMFGTYRIGNTGDFADVYDLKRNLDIAGTSNPVLAILERGTHRYNHDTIDFFSIEARLNNQNHLVTIRGATGNPDDVHLRYNHIRQAYLALENLTLDVTPSTVLDTFLYGASHNTFSLFIKNCRVKGNGHLPNLRPYFDVIATKEVIVQESEFTDLSEALRLFMPKNNVDKRVLVENSRFLNVGVAIKYGLDPEYFSPPFPNVPEIVFPNFKIWKNKIDKANTGIYIICGGYNELSLPPIIAQNRIANCQVGISTAALLKSIIANNFVQASELSVELYDPNECRIIHNSFSGTARIQRDWQNTMLNNSFFARDTPLIIAAAAMDTFFQHDYNNFFSLNSKPLSVYDLNDDRWLELNLSDYRRLFNRDTHSISLNPRYLSTTDLHIDTLSPLNGAGGGIFFGITTDIDNQNRLTIRNDIGADEVGVFNSNVCTVDTTRLNRQTCDATRVGETIQILPRTGRCDSIVITKITLKTITPTNLRRTICAGETVKIGSETFANSGNYTVRLQNTEGCDSTVNLALTVLQADTIRSISTTCIAANVGADTVRLRNRFSCDSIRITGRVFSTVDTVKPIFQNCPRLDTVFTLTTIGNCATFNFIEPTATDNCSLAQANKSHLSGECFPVNQTTQVLYTATDRANNFAVCRFRVRVIRPNATTDLDKILSKMQVEPNPTEGGIWLNFESSVSRTVQFVIYDALGKQVFETQQIVKMGMNRLEFDVRALPSGVFYVQPISVGEQGSGVKFVKM
jgi:PKD repeat protein